MSPSPISERPLQYFIHYDFDALRMEISGSFAGIAAQRAYNAWRRASSLAGRLPLVVDISYVTDADALGRAALRAWRRQHARIVASSQLSRAIADATLSATAPRPSPHGATRNRLAALFSWLTAGIPAQVETADDSSAVVKHNDAVNAGLLPRGEMEQYMR
jgi:hypothetical protein